MILPMLKGTTEIIEAARESETIENGCPACQQDLVLKQFRTWGTLFTIPLAPRKSTRFVYECTSCAGTFDPAMRKTFINRSKYVKVSEDEVLQMRDAFSLTILASVLAADGPLTTKEMNLLYTFISLMDSDTRLHLHLASGFAQDGHIDHRLWEQHDLFCDCFAEELRNGALAEVTAFLQNQELLHEEKKLLQEICRNWNTGLEVVQM
jgi:hypothetical protein